MNKLNAKKPKETKATMRALPTLKRQQAERLSGMSMKDVGVHYNSNLPNQMGCHALTYGNQICLAPSQEKHMDHELGHVIQQKKGLVKPQVGNWNFSHSLEKGADNLGAKITNGTNSYGKLNKGGGFKGVFQGKPWDDGEFGEYILSQHHTLIENAYGKGTTAFSFRKAGKDTMNLLKLGFAMKGHEVLEKSIKDKSLKDVNWEMQSVSGIEHDPLESGVTFKDRKVTSILKLSGLIGNWKGAKGERILQGVYLSKKGEDNIKSSTVLKGLAPSYKDGQIYPISDAFANYFDTEEHKKQLHEYFLTGDYDMHDIRKIDEDGGYKAIANTGGADTIAQNSLAKTLKQSVQDGDLLHDEFSYIRHGPQYNFVDYMKDHEKGRKAAYPVINADPDLLFYNPNPMKREGETVTQNTDADYKGWYHTKSMDDLFKYYKEAFAMKQEEIPKYFGNTKEAKKEQAKERYEIYRLGMTAPDKLEQEPNLENISTKDYMRIYEPRLSYAAITRHRLSQAKEIKDYLDNMIIKPLGDSLDSLGYKIKLFEKQKSLLKIGGTESVSTEAVKLTVGDLTTLGGLPGKVTPDTLAYIKMISSKKAKEKLE